MIKFTTQKEAEETILLMMAKGHTNSEISLATKYTRSSVETIRGRMIRRNGAKNSVHMMVMAIAAGALKICSCGEPHLNGAAPCCEKSKSPEVM